MKILKFLLYTVLILFVVYLILCATGPKHMSATTSMLIKASPDAIYEEICDFNRWPAWSPWHKMDTAMKSTTTGNPCEPGHKQAWVSANRSVGTGSQTFVELRANEYIKSEMRFMGEDSSPAYGEFLLKPEAEGTLVTWSMDGGDTPFMLRGMMKVMNMEKMVTDQFIQGLTDLKKVAESKPKMVPVTFELIDMPEQWYVAVTHPQLNVKNITGDIYDKGYAAIGKAIEGKATVTGMPMSIMHNFDEATGVMDLEVAMPVSAEVKVGDGLVCKSIPAGKVAKYIFHGPYEGVGVGWSMFMGEVMKTHKPRWSSYEIYANDPSTVASPAEYETWLMQPVE